MAGEYKNLHGSSITFPNRPTLSLSIVQTNVPGRTVRTVEDMDLSKSVVAEVPIGVTEVKDTTFTTRFVPGIAIPIGQDPEPIRIVMPKIDGQTTAGYFEGTGFIKEIGDVVANSSDRSTRDVTIKWNTDPVWTPGS